MAFNFSSWTTWKFVENCSLPFKKWITKGKKLCTYPCNLVYLNINCDYCYNALWDFRAFVLFFEPLTCNFWIYEKKMPTDKHWATSLISDYFRKPRSCLLACWCLCAITNDSNPLSCFFFFVISLNHWVHPTDCWCCGTLNWGKFYSNTQSHAF